MYSTQARRMFWLAIGSGLSPLGAADRAGVSTHAAHRWLAEAGGVIPSEWLAPRSGRYLDIAERERLGELLHDKTLSLRGIARQLGRSPSTISRELRRNAVDPAVLPAHPSRQPGEPTGRRGSILKRHNYRPVKAQWRADLRTKRPKPTKLSGCSRLRREVESRLKRDQSPEQIGSRLVKDFPDDLEMRVSHETIYLELYVQARGGLKRELTQHLRTGRALRKPHRKPDQRRGRIVDMINIADRPAEVADRIIPGHWEGDLIIG